VRSCSRILAAAESLSSRLTVDTLASLYVFNLHVFNMYVCMYEIFQQCIARTISWHQLHSGSSERRSESCLRGREEVKWNIASCMQYLCMYVCMYVSKHEPQSHVRKVVKRLVHIRHQHGVLVHGAQREHYVISPYIRTCWQKVEFALHSSTNIYT
jgi:hypothetical protein